MANQITIDIVAQTQKLTSGINDANNQLNGLKTGLDKTQQAAVGVASAFVLKAGVSFLSKANEEAIDAEKTAKAAAAAFGEGSTALQKITTDAEKFADELAIDNDEIIKLATGLGVRLPKDAQGASAELVLLAKNLEASSGGAIAAESTLSKLGKAFVDGEVSAKELAKVVPGLSESVYDQAAALSAAGKNQEAMNFLVDEGAKRFGGAAADQVTGAQQMEKAMGDLYEMIGTYVAPVVEKLTKFISDLIGFVVENKNVIVPLVAVLGTFAAGILILNAGLTAYNAIMAAWKVATTLATVAQTVFNAVMAANPIGLVILAIAAIIAIIVLLVKNWDTVTEVVGKVWDAIKDFAEKAWNKIKEFVENVIEKFQNFKEKVGEIWSNIKDKIGDLVQNIVNKIKEIPGKMLDIGEDIVRGLWNGIKNMANWIKDKISDLFGNVVGWAKKALGIKSPSKIFAGIGKNIAQGLWTGLNGQKTYLKNNFEDFFGDIIPALTLDSLNLPDFENFATQTDLTNAIQGASVDNSMLAGEGLEWDPINEQYNIDDSVVTFEKLAQLLGTDSNASTYNITVNAGTGTDPYSVGRAVTSALDKYSRVSPATGQRVTL
jgi:phage-related protein